MGIDLKGEKVKKTLLKVTSILLFLIVWWVISVVYNRPRIFPSPVLVVEKLGFLVLGKCELGSSSYNHLGRTIFRLLIAFCLGFSIGSSVGILMGRVRRAYDFFDNLAWIFICVPAIVWAFILVVTFGTTNFTAIGVVIALIAPKIALNVSEGAKTIPPDLIEMADSFRATLFQKVREIYIPHLLPYFFGGARIGFSIGLKVIIVAELVGLNSGIGYMIDYWWDRFFLAPIIAWALFLVFTGLLIEYGVFKVLETRSRKWVT